MKHQRLIAGTLMVAGALNAVPVEVRRTWDELPGTIIDRNITMMLPDRTEVRGVVRWIEKDSLIVDIRKTSNSTLHPKGLTSVPREQVSTIDMQLSHGRDRGDDTGTRIGATLGGVLLAPVALGLGDGESVPEWVAVLVWVGGMVIGAIIGHFLTRHSDGHILIRVIPGAEPLQSRRRSMP